MKGRIGGQLIVGHPEVTATSSKIVCWGMMIRCSCILNRLKRWFKTVGAKQKSSKIVL
jgi:hypothetical protein